MYKVIHLDIYRSITHEYAFASLDNAKKCFEEIRDKHAFDAVAIEDAEGQIVMQN